MELLREIWATARRNKLRTSLTGFAVAWGIFMLIFLLGAGNGLINAQTQQMNRFIANSMVVFGGYTTKPYNGLKEGRYIAMKNSDLDITNKAFPDKIDDVGAEIEESGQVISLGQNYISTTIKGVDPSYSKIQKIEMLQGRFINDIDLRDRRKVLVLSKNNAKELTQQYGSLIGKYLKVNDLSFQVVGIYKDDESRQTNEVYTSFTTFKTIYNKGDNVGNIIFSFHGVNNIEESDIFERAYKQRIHQNHDIAPDDDAALWLWNRYRQNISMGTGMGIIRTALWIIGLLTLLSGIVGISNIMLITVKERTHEFGIRKAIGAKPFSILKLIIVESVAITSIFGYIGMLIGIIANEWMNATIGNQVVEIGEFKATMFLNPTVGLDVCFEATMVMIIAGTIAGLIPAYKASKVRPIEALNSK